jgi:hypothetical protein
MNPTRWSTLSLIVALALCAAVASGTILNTASRADYVGTGSLATYAYPFRILAASDLTVTKRDTAGVETPLVLTTDYTVTGVGAGTGGTITLTAGNLPSGYALTIRRVMPLTQPTDLRNQGPFLAETHETVFDRLTMQNQQQQDELSRSIRIPESISPSAFSTLLPATVTTSGGHALIVKTDGTGIDTVPVNPGSIFTSPAITGTVTGGASYQGIGTLSATDLRAPLFTGTVASGYSRLAAVDAFEITAGDTSRYLSIDSAPPGGAALRLGFGSAGRMYIPSGGSLIPTNDNAQDLGNASFSFRTAYVKTSLVLGGGTAMTKILSATATLDFPLSALTGCDDLTMTVTGATDGDLVTVAPPAASVGAESSFTGYVSAANTVTVKHCSHALTYDPASGSFRAMVTKF